MPTEADFEDGVVTERLVTVRFRLTGDRYSFQVSVVSAAHGGAVRCCAARR
jgi:hypothetical protein